MQGLWGIDKYFHSIRTGAVLACVARTQQAFPWSKEGGFRRFPRAKMGRSPCHSLLPNRTETLAAQARAVYARITTHAPCVRPLFGFNGESAREDTGGEARLVPRSRVSLHYTNQFDKERSVFKTMRFSKGPLSSASVFISVFRSC